MRLESRHDPTSRLRSERSLNRGGYFGRMMRIVVDDADAGDIAKVLKSPVDTTKPNQALPHLIEGRAEGEAGSDRGQRVLHVVVSRHTQHDVAERLPVVGD